VASTPTSQFTIKTDGTAVDSKTGLMWKICNEGEVWDSANNKCTGNYNVYSWIAALEHVKSNNSVGFANYKDWRLPNVKELRSIIETQCTEPSVNLQVFPTTNNSIYWSSSPAPENTFDAWGVPFGYIPNIDTKDTIFSQFNSYIIRLVRN
jgi:hypothetical protein